ncbi:DnaJ domain-containing protein [Candidatus Uhrbacteria bacterium]|nr:DnaJ domain-containing protein [Candidatus Uhrbacteria bacterium]
MRSKFESNPFLQTDPGSQEHNPTQAEIEKNLELSDSFNNMLFEVESELRDPGHFDYDYMAPADELRVMDPQDLWMQISYAWLDYGDHITDPEEKQRLKQKVESLDRGILKHFVPFLESQVKKYGRFQTFKVEHPEFAEKHKRRSDSYDYLMEQFDVAYYHINNYSISLKDKALLSSEFDQLKQKSEEYFREPWLYSFEKREADLWNSAEISYFLASHYHDNLATFGGDPKQDDRFRKLEALYDQALALNDIVAEMKDDEIKNRSKIRAQNLLGFIERQLLEYTAPKDLLKIDAQLDDIISDLNDGAGEAVALRLEAIKSKIDSMSKLKSAAKVVRDLYAKIINKYNRAVRQKDGESFAEEEIQGIAYNNPNWALVIMGLDSAANPASIKQAYKNLVTKHHPDLFQDEAEKEKQTKIMQKINEAFMFLKNIGKLEENH